MTDKNGAMFLVEPTRAVAPSVAALTALLAGLLVPTEGALEVDVPASLAADLRRIVSRGTFDGAQ